MIGPPKITILATPLLQTHFPLYKQPVEVGCFSLDPHRSFYNDQRQLRYYVQPRKSPDLNLRDSYTSRFVKRDDCVKEKLDHVLKWILPLKNKLLKWWAQSFLPGVPQIVAGFRDHDGIVVSVETFQTSKISQLIKNEYNCWKPTVCMNFCNDFLSFVKSVVKEDGPRLVYLFKWDPHRDVTFTVHRDSQYTFLPEWYIKDMRSHPSSHH
uniref:Decapping nuclease n=1 Tax=Sinocyclocheilus grahami TaxID=75366 RepID=A0A672QKP6_SINGR